MVRLYRHSCKLGTSFLAQQNTAENCHKPVRQNAKNSQHRDQQLFYFTCVNSNVTEIWLCGRQKVNMISDWEESLIESLMC